MRRRPPLPPPPSLAQRGLELARLALPGARMSIERGRLLRYWFSVAPTAYSRVYRCLLRIPRNGFPEMVVLEPDLRVLAGARPLPHIYPHDGLGTQLCLWLPRMNEWVPAMPLADTYLAWAAEWLNYFEEWLYRHDSAGGGEHPRTRQKRWSRR